MSCDQQAGIYLVMWNRELKDRLAKAETELAKLKTQIAELKTNFGHLTSENHWLRAQNDELLGFGIVPAKRVWTQPTCSKPSEQTPITWRGVYLLPAALPGRAFHGRQKSPTTTSSTNVPSGFGFGQGQQNPAIRRAFNPCISSCTTEKHRS
jgi:hypothetical protein